MSIKELCRTCLCPTANKSTLWDAIESPLEADYEPKPIVIVDLLKSLPRIDFSDAEELPDKICMLCINQIKRICSFVVNCEKNEKTLKQVLAVENDENITTLKFKLPTISSNSKRRKKTKVELSGNNTLNDNDSLLVGLAESDESQCKIKSEIKTEMTEEIEENSDDNISEDSQTAQTTMPAFIKEEPELELEADVIELNSSDSDDDDANCEFSADIEDELETFYSYVERSNARLWCSKCEGQFPSKRMYDDHLAECRKLLECDECLMTFRDKDEYEEHCQIAHTQMDTSQSDNTLSDGEINTKENLYMPMSASKKQHSDEARQYQCRYCPKSFSIEGRLRSHIKCHNKSHCCTKCMKSFRSSHHLKAHNMRVHGATWKSIHCGVCKRYFACNADYVRHQLTHTKEKPYECNKCPERYRYKKFLENHIKQSHPEVSEEETLQYIKVRYGGKKLPEILDSTFTCIVCGQNVDRAKLAEHVNSHKRK